MTRPDQRPPAALQVESGSDAERTAPAAVPAAGDTGPEPRAKAETEAATELRTAGAEETAPAPAPAAASGGKMPDTAEPASAAEPGGEAPDTAPDGEAPDTSPGTSAAATGTSSGTAADTEADAAAMDKSRLPAFVRTMTATAIDRPRTETGPVGRPGKAALAGAALGGALLVSVPFLLMGGKESHDRAQPAAAETVLGGSGGEVPGDYAVTQPDASPSGKRTQEARRPSGSGHGGTHAPAPARQSGPPAPKKESGAKDAPKSGAAKGDGAPKKSAPKAGTAKKSRSTQNSGTTKKAGSGLLLNFPVSLHSHLSGRCIDVPGSDFGDGKQLWVWDCNNSEAQKFQFASDGTVRIQGKCLDVANANYNNGTPIQIAWCNGNNAQKFALNPAHDLVNTVVGKCVDIRDNNRGSGAWLQLWDCAGTDNQKWSV
ncbi:ricin-type beta-trefoil lectin domain protein [Streptomyces griseoluteus]|uniref:ricin-type beta-trefoil lectin domain protein n=1 Tax=Streptomyces griseoluteus TaxID=29306 RepID=UPI0036589D03